MNGYMSRMEAGDYTGSDTVALLLEKYAGITPAIKLSFANGVPRRDILMPIYKKGSATYLGLLRHEASMEPASSILTFDREYHVWDMRSKLYLGYAKTVKINLDMTPMFLAVLPADPTRLSLTAQTPTVKQGAVLCVDGIVSFDGDNSDKMGQAVHVRVYSPDWKELECFRRNIVFDGDTFHFELPFSYSEEAGLYSIVAEHCVTGMKAETLIEVTK